MRRVLFLGFIVIALSITAVAQEHQHLTPLKPSPEFEQMKKLIGKWERTADGHTSTTEFRLTGGGSAIMEIMNGGTEYEMITMYHMDGNRFVATHYCAAHNQPRMEAQPSHGGNTVEFKYVDGTNIQPGYVRMENVKMTLADADHHTELWTSTENGKEESVAFDYHRLK